MPQEINDRIISGAAHISRDAESDESMDEDNMAEMFSFAKENLHMFALMVNAFSPTKDCKHDAKCTREFTEFAHATLEMTHPDMSSNSKTQWEKGGQESNVNSEKRGGQHALTSMASDAWKEYKLTNHDWYNEDPI